MSYGPAEHQQAHLTPAPKGPLLGLAALVLGLIGAVVTFLPVPLDVSRPYLAWTFGLPGLVVAVFGLLGHRRGKALAAIGAVLSLLAVFVGVITIGNVVGVL